MRERESERARERERERERESNRPAAASRQKGVLPSRLIAAVVANSWVRLCLCLACRVCALRKADPDAGPLFVKMLTLSVQLLQSAELAERAVNGVWFAVECTVQGPSAMVGPAAMELGIVELAASQLRKLGTASDLLVRPDRSLCMF